VSNRLVFSLQCFDTVGWATKAIWPEEKAGCWFVDGDILTGALHVIAHRRRMRGYAGDLTPQPRLFYPHSKISSDAVAPVVTTTSIVLSSNEVRNGDILLPANSGSPGKWPLERR